MDDIVFMVGDSPPKGFHKTFQENIFNTSAHRKLQTADDWLSFYVLHPSRKMVTAQFHCHLKQAKAMSPYKSPFGSIEFSEKLKYEDLYAFIRFVEKELIKRGAGRLIIKGFPQSYHPTNFAKLSNAFFNLGYQVENSELGAAITIDNTSFSSKVDIGEKGRLKKCLEKGLAFTMDSNDSLGDIYEHIEHCSKERNFRLSMTKEELLETHRVLPEMFQVFSVRDQGELIAGSITVKVNETTLYNFYLGHLKAYNAYSPVMILFEGIYNYCRDMNIELLDLGTSALKDGPNYGLVRFKQRIGGALSLKLTFQKQLQ